MQQQMVLLEKDCSEASLQDARSKSVLAQQTRDRLGHEEMDVLREQATQPTQRTTRQPTLPSPRFYIRLTFSM